MSQSDWIDLTKFLVTVAVSILAARWTWSIQDRQTKLQASRVKAQNDNDASETAVNALKTSREATEELVGVRQELKEQREKLEAFFDSISGKHLLEIEFELGELVRLGRTNVLSGSIHFIGAHTKSSVQETDVSA